MELHICNNTGIREVKTQFARFFPFLKLEFFTCSHHSRKTSEIDEEPYYGMYVAETSEFFREGVVNFSPATTVADFQTQIRAELGLFVKVFRRSGDLWADTSPTSYLTLARQNSMGAASSRPAESNRYTFFL